jgi:hypothetical protein
MGRANLLSLEKLGELGSWGGMEMNLETFSPSILIQTKGGLHQPLELGTITSYCLA